MDLSPSRWPPQWGYEGKRDEVVLVTTEAKDKPSSGSIHSAPVRRVVADFLLKWLADAPTYEEEATASFLYVSLNRPLSPDESPPLEINKDGPLVVFGFGEFPAAPEEWDVIPLAELIRYAVRWLRADQESG